MNSSIANASIRISALFPVLEGISDAVFIDDKDGICIWCNSTCEEFYVESREKLFGKTVDELVALGIFTQSVTKEVLNKGIEATLIHENKRGKRLLTSGYPIRNEHGEIVYIITISRDITRLTTHYKQSSTLSKQLLDINAENSVILPDSNIVASSQAMQNVLTLVKRLAAVDSPVLLTGESGVGKGLIAKTLHEQSSRSSKPFIHVNCGAIPDTLIESELFGYVRGTFTGTRAEGNIGLFESASGGTVFLDEITEMPLNIQIKVLRVIQSGIINRVGSIKPVNVDVRIIAATNKDLLEQVRNEKFRDDLYYSLNVAPISVPPLRERPEDIPPLIRMYLAQFNKELNEAKTLSPEALTILLKYKWPGNIRELRNMIERIILTTADSVIEEENLPTFLIEEAETNTNINTDTSLQAAIEKAEKEILSAALKSYKSTRAMAKVLQVSQPTIVRKLNKYGLTSFKDE